MSLIRVRDLGHRANPLDPSLAWRERLTGQRFLRSAEAALQEGIGRTRAVAEKETQEEDGIGKIQPPVSIHIHGNAITP